MGLACAQGALKQLPDCLAAQRSVPRFLEQAIGVFEIHGVLFDHKFFESGK